MAPHSNLSTPVPKAKRTPSKRMVRIAVSFFYFAQGICFATWASRIPDLKTTLQLSDAQLGTILLALPLGQLLMMPVSGKLTTAFGTKKMLIIGAPLYALAMANLSLATAGWQLALFLLLFGVAGNICNNALNTQGVIAETFFEKPIMSSFHGVWSMGGFTGALIGLLMVNLQIIPLYHFAIIGTLVWVHIAVNCRFLLAGQKSAEGKKTSFFKKPQGVLLQLGLIGFCSMATEGAMFDWSGVYFKEIVKAPNSLIILGYASFMVMMATGRFLGDRLIANFGRKRLLQVSGVIISSGMFIAVLFPYLVSATIAFMMVGIGVSGIVPMVYSIAGNNDKVAPGIALAMVGSVSYFGFLMGPPLIGYISALSNLRYSYAVIGCFGLFITVVVAKLSAIK